LAKLEKKLPMGLGEGKFLTVKIQMPNAQAFA